MKSLSDVKRRATTETVFHCENFIRPEASGLRRIVKTQTNGCYYIQLPEQPEARRHWISMAQV